MSLNLNKNPGYLYQLSRGKCNIDSIARESCGIKSKEETLYLYLIPSKYYSCINPFNNRRLKSVLNEVDVVVFDFPVEEKSSPQDNMLKFCDALQMNAKEEDLMRINNVLSERLKNSTIGKIQIDDMVCEDSKKLANLVAGKVLFLMMENCALEMKGLGTTESIAVTNELFQEQIGPKEHIYQKAKSAGKIIEYIVERSFIEQNKELLFSKGLLEDLICLVMTDSELVQNMTLENKNEIEAWNSGALNESESSLLEKTPTFTDFRQKFAGDVIEKELSNYFTLAEKIDGYLSTNKTTLLVLVGNPKIIKPIKCYIDVLNPDAPRVKEKRLVESVGCFWKIKKGTVTIGYLLGSIHLTPEYLLDLNSRIRKCFEKSARLAVEIDITGKESGKNFTLLEQKLLQEKLSNFSAEQIENICNALQKLFPEDSSRFDLSSDEGKAQFISCGLSRLKSKIFAELGLSSGIDLQLINQAKKIDKPIESLETLEQYATQETTQQSLAKDPIKDLFLEMLSSVVSTKEEGLAEACNFVIEQISLILTKELDPMFEAWVEGNLEEFADKEQSISKKMDMAERNLNIAKKIVSLFKEKGKAFSCVGVGHTVGAMSVLSFLNQFGLITERVFV